MYFLKYIHVGIEICSLFVVYDICWGSQQGIWKCDFEEETATLRL